MHAFAIINFHELNPAALCDVIVHKFHAPVEQTAGQIMAYFNVERQQDEHTAAAADIQGLLFTRLQTEVLQLVRKEAQIVFPVIRNQPGTRCIQPSTCNSIRQSFQRIMLLLQKLRQVSSNYQVAPEWSSAYKLCITDIYLLEQRIQQWLYVAQNILYPAVTVIVQRNESNNTSSID